MTRSTRELVACLCVAELVGAGVWGLLIYGHRLGAALFALFCFGVGVWWALFSPLDEDRKG